MQGIADVKGAGDSKISLILEASIFEDGFSVGHIDANVMEAIGGDDYEQLESAGTIDAQVRLVPPEMFAFTLAYFTGSKEHNIAMRQRAIDRGLRLNEFGLIPEDKAGELKGIEAAQYSLSAMTEQEIYSHLDLQWVPPELREDTGEIQSGTNRIFRNYWNLIPFKALFTITPSFQTVRRRLNKWQMQLSTRLDMAWNRITLQH